MFSAGGDGCKCSLKRRMSAVTVVVVAVVVVAAVAADAAGGGEGGGEGASGRRGVMASAKRSVRTLKQRSHTRAERPNIKIIILKHY